jgi:hypothetical protein
VGFDPRAESPKARSEAKVFSWERNPLSLLALLALLGKRTGWDSIRRAERPKDTERSEVNPRIGNVELA